MPRSAFEDKYDEFRARSKVYTEMRNQSMQLSRQAFQKGDKKKAKILSNEGKEFKKLMDKENRIASNKIFDLHNSKKTIDEIDLHGLFVAEAIERLNQRVKLAKQCCLPNLVVIVGRGIHSERGPKIKPAVVKYANKNNIQYQMDSPNAGCITFEFDGIRVKQKQAESEYTRSRSTSHPRSTSRSRPRSKPRQLTYKPEVVPTVRPTTRSAYNSTDRPVLVTLPSNTHQTTWPTVRPTPRPAYNYTDQPVFITMPSEPRRSIRESRVIHVEPERTSGSSSKIVLTIFALIIVILVLGKLLGVS